MRTLLLTVLMAAATVVAPASDDPSLSGSWQLKRIAADRESTMECSFNQKGSELTGSCKSDRGTLALSGKVEGKNVTWTHKSESEAGPVTVVYTGTIDSATRMTGKVLAVEFSVEGEFTATRAK